MKVVLKVIQLHTNEEKTIKKALKSDRKAQQLLYSSYAPKMLSVCRYYIKDIHFAEDVMISGFAKVFQNLSAYRFEGSFEGWIRKIMVREAVSFLRSKKDFICKEAEDVTTEIITYDYDLTAEMMQMLVDKLPDGYKTVFVMYAIEGYAHREIAEILQISEGTSKSQLSKARKLLQQQLQLISREGNGTI